MKYQIKKKAVLPLLFSIAFLNGVASCSDRNNTSDQNENEGDTTTKFDSRRNTTDTGHFIYDSTAKK